jgi:hypothetical protein
MTIAELREILSRFPDGMRVVTAGFDEAGIDDIERVEIRKVRFDANPDGCHIGRHEECENGTPCIWIDW